MPLDPTIVIIFGSLFLSLLASLVYAVWYQQFKHKHKTGKRTAQHDLPESIRVSELEALIRKATTEATLPLEERLSLLEAEVTSLHDVLEQEGAIPERRGEPLVELPEDEREEEGARSRPRRRIR